MVALNLAKAGKGVLYLYRTGVLYRVVIKFRVIGGSTYNSKYDSKKETYYVVGEGTLVVIILSLIHI